MMVRRKDTRIILNSAANIVGKIWSMLSIIVFMPIYIHYLGEEQYGIVSFFTTFQTLLLLMNGGFNTSIKREFSVNTGENINDRKYQLLKSTELLFSILSIIVLTIVCSCSSIIATRWLNIGTMDKEYVIQSIDLIGLTIVLQVFSTLYLGCLQGLEHQVASNTSQSLFYLIRNIGALLIVKYISPDVRLFFLCYIISEISFLIINRTLVLLFIPHDVRWHLRDFVVLRSIFAYTMGVFGISVISVFNAQLDKVLISKYMSLSDITYYSIATSVGQVPLLLINAIAVAFFPKLVQALSTNSKKIGTLYIKCSSVFSLIAIPIACFMSACMYHLILLWQGKPETAQYTFIPGILLTVANTLYCLQVTADNCLLAEKNTSYLIYKNVGSMVVSFISMIILIPKYGLLGGALSYFIVAFLCWLFYSGYVHTYYTHSSFLKWVFVFVALPGFLSSGVAIISSKILLRVVSNTSLIVLSMVFLGGTTFTLIALLYRNMITRINEDLEDYE